MDQLVEYRQCVMHSKWSWMPLFGKFGACKQLNARWVACENNREWEIKETEAKLQKQNEIIDRSESKLH